MFLCAWGLPAGAAALGRSFLAHAAFLGLFGVFLAAPVEATPTLEQEQEIRTTFAKPPTKWAKPYAGGTTRVLFFSDYKNTQAREIVELMQRFEVQANAAYYTRVKVAKKSQMQWHGGEEGIARIRRLLDSGAHDVFLFNGVSPDALPAALKQDLLARVAQGKGLVLVGVKERGRLDPPLENDPDRVALDEPLILDQPLARRAEAGDPEAELFAWRQGRAARLPAAPVADYTFGWEIPYDHWQERLGRTVLWAAGKLPAQPLQLRRKSGTDTGIVAQSSPEARLVVTWPADAPIAQVRIRERRDDGLIVRDSSNPLPPGGGGVRVGGKRDANLPVELTGPAAAGLPAGRYHDEVIATDAAGRVVAWATLPFAVASPHTVNLELSRTWGEIGDALAGTATVAGPALESGRVSVELRDRRGRMLAATPAMPANAGATPFSFAIPEWYPIRVQVRAVLRNEVGDVADAVAYFNVTQRHRDRYIPTGPTAAWAHEALARLGVTLELGYFAGPYRVLAAYDNELGVTQLPVTCREDWPNRPARRGG